MAEKLVLSYHQKEHELEVEEKKVHFVLEQLEDPTFELSSLSTTLLDPTTKALATRASELTLQLYDDNTRSQREKERIQDELITQRKFLKAHLLQVESLLQLQRHLVEGKQQALHALLLDLIQQQVLLVEREV